MAPPCTCRRKAAAAAGAGRDGDMISSASGPLRIDVSDEELPRGGRVTACASRARRLRAAYSARAGADQGADPIFVGCRGHRSAKSH